jgi:hypothetical protein
MKGSRPWNLFRAAAGLIILATCTSYDQNFFASAARSNSSKSPRRDEPNNYGSGKLRNLGRAVPARKRGYTRTIDNSWGSSTQWSSGMQTLPFNRGSKSSKGSGKSGKARPPTPVIQQIIVYIPHPTRMPVTPKPTISPKPTMEPTPSPTRHPSETPSVAPTALASEVPSDFPSSVPSVHPSRLASEEPSDEPSSFPTIHPSSLPSESLSSIPSELPSLATTMLPSEVPSAFPSLEPTQIPTAKPESFNLSNMPSSIGLKSPVPTEVLDKSSSVPTLEVLETMVPSLAGTDKPTKQARTSKPSHVGTEEGSYEPTKAENVTTSSPDAYASIMPTEAVTSPSPTTVNTTSLIPTQSSAIPTLIESNAPTTNTTLGSIVDERQNLQMQLFGIEALTPDLIEVYQRETEAYIEDFYNNYNGTDSLRTSVRGVTATLKVTNWTEPTDTTDVIAEEKAQVIVLDVTEPCTGQAPLTVTFTLELQYRVRDPELYHLNVIISAPFTTVESREVYIGDYLQSDGEFSKLYCSSRMILSEGMTLAPTPTVTLVTGEVITDEREELMMMLYGIDLMTPSRIQAYEQETAAYIEDFYNKYTKSDGIRGKVSDVSATVTVTDWTPPSNPSVGAKRLFPRKIGRAAELTADDKAKVVVLDVSEPCVGESPLTVTFSLKLKYSIRDPKLAESDLIISAPFLAVDSRAAYIGKYLQSGDEFNALYCSSRIVFADGGTPAPTRFTTPVFPGGETPSPSIVNGSITPTMTSVPTENMTGSLVPTLISSSNETSSVPTIMNGTTSPTPSVVSSMPTFNGTSNATILNGTQSPTVANSTNVSLVPTLTPIILNASIAPSVVNATIAPSVLNTSTSIVPTILNTSTAPTTLTGTSLAPSISPNTTSATPTVLVTVVPTATLPPWEMRMFGQSENFLETAQALYNDRTAVFIEEYYNSGEEEGLRGQISEMDATVEIVGQIPPDTTSRSYLPIGSSAALGTRRHRSKKHSDEDTISFSPNEKHFEIGDRRILQDDPCSGPFLLLRLKITITYVTSDDNLTPEEILMDAFSTPEARDTYLNNYLVGGVAGEAAFGSVACTSELLETNAVPTPAASSAVPTIAILGSSMPTATVTQPTNNALGNETSLVPTVAFNSTLSSPPVGNVTASLQPTQANIGATGVPTIISVIPDTNSTGSGAPSNGLQTTSTPTLGGNTTTLPPANRENDDEVDDIFGDPQKSVRSSPTHDRKCSNVDTNMRSDTEEIAIRFVYGMETKSQGDYLISDVEDLILDFLTTSVLRCTAGVLQTSVKPRMNRDVIDFGVIRIRYPGNGDITSISKCLVYLVYALTPSGELTASPSLNTTSQSL